MGKIFYIMGKSSSGKDTIYKRLFCNTKIELKKIVMYTTRPIREGENNGEEYYFVNDDTLQRLEQERKVIEVRAYNTIYGIWKYFTVNDSQIDLEINNYLMIGTLESYIKTKAYYGEEVLEPIYIEVNDGIRLERALKREQLQPVPKYEEMCRRFLADQQDFSEEKLFEAGVKKKFANVDLEKCILDITNYITEIV
jgi:guanylate kinase